MEDDIFEIAEWLLTILLHNGGSPSILLRSVAGFTISIVFPSTGITQ